MTTAERLNKVASHIETLPHARMEDGKEQERVRARMDAMESRRLEEFNLGIYTCGTAGCVAAHVIEVLGTAVERERMYDNNLDVRSTALRLLLNDQSGADSDYGEWEAGGVGGALFYGPDTDASDAEWLGDLSGPEYDKELTPQRAAYAMRLYARGHRDRPWNRAIEEMGK